MNSESNRRIARNTGLLYIRTLLTLAVSLYTSRIVLNTLGIEDYGIYNVVGGVVTMLGFLNNSMARSTQRFLSYEIGKNDLPQLARVFSMSVNIHFIIALIIIALAETVGLWVVNTQLTIPVERISAAKWVYQFSILAFLATTLSVPNNAAIIANERMNVYAYVSIIEVTLKLLMVFLLQWFGFDKLKLYALLVFSVSLLTCFIYGFYCWINFKECQYRFFWDKRLFSSLLSFAGWNLWGVIAVVTFNQGINILLNIFFDPVINAARAIAYQVNGAVTTFITNFQLAMNPQIVKSYANRNIIYMHQLVYTGSKFSFFLLYFLSLPILIETELILYIWLSKVPEYSIIFCRLVIICSLIESVSGPLVTAAQATGNIKLYQTVIGALFLLILPSSYIFLKLGYPPQITLYITIIVSIIVLFSRILFLRSLINLSIKLFIKKVLLAIFFVSSISAIAPYYIFINMDQGITRFFLICFISSFSILILVYFFGTDKTEKEFVINKTKKIWMKVTNK